MATKAHDCLIKKNNTICPECGRSAPDWCGKDAPVLTPLVHVPTGSDLEKSRAEVADAAEETAKIVAEQKDAVEKVFKKKASTETPVAPATGDVQ